MFVQLYNYDNSVVLAAEWFDPYPHYVEMHLESGEGFDTINGPSLEVWGFEPRR